MISTTLALVLSLVAAAATLQDRERIDQLLKQAEALNKEGKTAEALPLLAEAWALTAEVYWQQGNLSASGEAWRMAVTFGWKGESPAQKEAPAPRPVPPPAGVESAPPPPPPPAERAATPPPAARPQEPVPDETPRFERRRTVYEAPRRRRRVSDAALWETFALAPYSGPRHYGWHSLVNTPPLEGASVVPREMHHLRFMIDWAATDVFDNSQGGASNWDTQALTEHIEYNYGLTDRIQLGGRLSLGELLEGQDDVLTVFDGGQQIVPTGSRGFGLESLVLRGKWATPTSFADLGVLAEFKIPLGDEADFLTSQTFDIGVSGLLTKRWDRWSVHVNAGMVFPFGDVDLFTQDPDADPYFHAGAAVSFLALDVLSLFGQIEFNTSAFGDVALFDEPVSVVSGGGRYRIAERVYFGGAIGLGLSDESGAYSISGGLDVLF